MNADPKLIGDPVRIEGPNLATLLRPSDFRHEATRDFRSGAVSFGRVDGLGTWLKGRSGQVVEQFEIQDCHFAGPRNYEDKGQFYRLDMVKVESELCYAALKQSITRMKLSRVPQPDDEPDLFDD